MKAWIMRLCKKATTLEKQKGWVLIDALVGMLILTIALLAIAQGYKIATTANVRSTNKLDAMTWAQQTLEDYKQYDNCGKTDFDNTFKDGTAVTTSTKLTKYAQLTINGTISNPGHKAAIVAVTVTWKDFSGEPDKSITMASQYFTE